MTDKPRIIIICDENNRRKLANAIKRMALVVEPNTALCHCVQPAGLSIKKSGKDVQHWRNGRVGKGGKIKYQRK